MGREVAVDTNYGLNKTGDLRILNNSCDSMSRPTSYASQLKTRNADHLTTALKSYENDDFENTGLQIFGKNKLFKEIEETTNVEDKTLYDQALHRNELT